MGHYKIKVNVHPKYPNLYQFKYNQIESPMGSLVVQACRGIILDRDNDWAPVCHTYNKFFNLQEGHAAEIDWNTARVYEKLDGSLMQLYWYDNQWHVATSGTPDADCEVPYGDMTFKDLFWQTWNDLGYDMPVAPLKERHCYAFELMTKYNYIVVRHPEPRLVLHGVRNLTYGYELKPPTFCRSSWEIVKTFDFGYTDEIEKALSEMDGMQCEGFVIVDGSMNRVKMKCEDYVRKHRLVSSLNQRNLIDVIRQNEEAEFLAYFPEWQAEYDNLKIEYEDLVKEIETVYNENKNIRRQKDFANAVKAHRFSGAMFQLRNEKVSSVRDYLQKMNIKHLEQAMEKRR